MPAHLNKHVRSGYYYVVDGYYEKSLKTKSKTEAEAKLKQYNRGKFGLKPIPTVGQYYETWIKSKVPPLVRPSAAKNYQIGFTAHILPKFKHVSLGVLSHGDIVEFRNELMKGRSMKTVKNILSVFRVLYTDAQGDHEELQAKQPFHLKWQRQITEKPDPFTIQERDQILEWWKQNDFFYFPWVYVLFHTGMRPSEAAGLHWSDVDFERRTLSIDKSHSMVGIDQPTKTAKSVRRIEVSEDIMRLIALLPSHKLGIKHVFVNKEGSPINAKKWSEHNHWGESLKKLEIRHRKFYATRHTFITEMVRAEKNLKAIGDYVGTSITMIENNYAGVVSMNPQTAEPRVKFGKSEGENLNFSGEIMVAGPGFEHRHLPFDNLPELVITRNRSERHQRKVA